jgi:hypothetical protein
MPGNFGLEGYSPQRRNQDSRRSTVGQTTGMPRTGRASLSIFRQRPHGSRGPLTLPLPALVGSPEFGARCRPTLASKSDLPEEPKITLRFWFCGKSEKRSSVRHLQSPPLRPIGRKSMKAIICSCYANYRCSHVTYGCCVT